MKLYATTTSERASKGQGGQKYLDIVVRDEESNVIANLSFYPKKDKVPHRITLLNINSGHEFDIDYTDNIKLKTWEELETKGKRQKDENYLFESTDKTIKRIIDNPIDTRYN